MVVIGNVIRAWWFFLQCQGQKPDSDQGLAMRRLLTQPTYRLPQAANHDRLIGVRVFARLVRALLKGKGEPFRIYPDSEPSTAILDGTYRFYEMERDYLRKQWHHPSHYISWSDIISCGRLTGLFMLVLILLPALIGMIACWFRPNRVQLALVARELCEAAFLSYWISELKLKEVVDFIPFEKGSNFTYLFIKKYHSVDYVKFPSPGPLGNHNKVLLTDTLAISSGYQAEELAHYDTIRYRRTVKWLPEHAFTYEEKVNRSLEAGGTEQIGFYSHGSWVRHKSGHTNTGMNIDKAEFQLLEDLKALLQNSDVKLRVYAHPREKKPEVWEETKAFYEGYFGGLNYEFASPEVRTVDALPECDIVFAPYSSVVFERLFVGYKIFLATAGMKEGFPIPGTGLSNISFRTADELKERWDTASKLSVQEYYEHFGLLNYRFDSFPYFQTATS